MNYRPAIHSAAVLGALLLLAPLLMAMAPDPVSSLLPTPLPGSTTELLHLRRAADAGDAKAQLELGRLADRGGDAEGAFTLVGRAAAQHLPAAEAELAILRDRGAGTPATRTARSRMRCSVS